MVQKRARREEEDRLSLKPSLDPAYVSDQLRAIAPELPSQLSYEVVVTNDASKLREVSDALKQISVSAGKRAKEAIKLFRDKSLSQMLVASPKEFAEISKAARGNTVEAFNALLKYKDEFSKNPEKITEALVRIGLATYGGNPQGFLFLYSGGKEKFEPIYDAFSKNPEEVSKAFAKIFSTFGKDSKYAFWTLMHFAKAFAKNPSKAAETFSDISRLCGRRRISIMNLAFGLANFIGEDFTKDFSRLQKLAETASYSSLIYQIKEEVSEDNVKKKGIGEVKEEVRRLLSLLDEPEELIEQYGMGCLPDYKDRWEEGRDLAFSAGVQFEDREVFINFAYAKDTIGAQKARAIYEEYGIEYFARYSKKELEALYNHIGEKDDPRPLLLIANNKSDRNGGFYEDIESRAPLIEGGKYNVIIFEAETEDEFYDFARKFGEKYFGISALVIGGHGSADAIRLGPGDGEENFLDLSDIKELKNLYGLFAENAIVIMNSCSTAEKDTSIGPQASATWGVLLVAPEVPTSIKKFILNYLGLIKDAIYEEGGKKYYLGVEVSKEP